MFRVGEFTFRVAYSGTDTQNDILRVYAVRRCGVSAGALLYEKSGTALSTSTSTDVQWSPSSASDWREEVVDLTPVAGHDDIFILIVGIKGSDEGRTIHIDDLSFDGSSSGPGWSWRFCIRCSLGFFTGCCTLS